MGWSKGVSSSWSMVSYHGDGYVTLDLLCSGFWGVMCVGIFGRSCLIREVYETVCYCDSLQLPDTVNNDVLLMICVTGPLTVGNANISLPVSIIWRIVYCTLGCPDMCGCILRVVDPSCQADLLHAGVAMVMIDMYIP